ncbi:MAG: Fic/DOC family N-terminal domain-containing protein [Oceanospirillaceae bacterium]
MALAHCYLGELKGISATIPNEAILINTLTLPDAKHSFEIEHTISANKIKACEYNNCIA